MKKHIITAIAGLALFVPALTMAATNDMANYWSFDEGQGRSINDTFGGKNGAVTGIEKNGFGWLSGKAGTAFHFDGTPGQAVVIPDGSLSGSQGTISVWFRLDTLTDGNVLFSARSVTDSNIYIALMVDREGRPSLISRTSTNGEDLLVQSSKILNINEWYHLVFTADTNAYHFYVNSEEYSVAGLNNGRWIPDMTNNTLMYRIGALSSNPRTGVFTGSIDDVRVYSRALSQSDVKELFNVTNDAMTAVPEAIAPKLSMRLSQANIPFGGSVAIGWSGKNIDTCTKFGSWSGSTATSGEQVIVKIGSDSAYGLECSGKHGKVTQTVKVTIGEGASSSEGTGGTLTVTSTNVPAQLETKGMTKEQLIQAIIAKIAELQAEIKKIRGY